VIRLWNRVGPFRALALLLLLGAVGGGALVATDRPVKRPTTASSSTAYSNTADSEREDQKQLAEIESERADAERAARQDAQRKADEAAVSAAEQAKAVAKPSNSPKPGKSSTKAPGVPSQPNLPIPASCNEYSGVKATGCAILLSLGFGLDQMPCLDKLFQKESGWNVNAYNKSSGAGGIPQALPMSKMSSEGADWKTNAATQIRWGVKYIKGRWGSPCGAWAHSQSSGWY
jgi:hypothetical protein